MDSQIIKAIADPSIDGNILWHEAGNLVPYVIEVMAEKIQVKFPNGLGSSVETGCGKSTVLLSNLAKRHYSFTLGSYYAGTSNYENSLAIVQGAKHFRPENVTFIEGPSQLTLPKFDWGDMTFDFALIDGAHAYPFPEMDYFYFYHRLNPGAIFMIDDVHIPTINRLYNFMKEDPMFVMEDLWGSTAFFRRTDAPTFSPYGDGWTLQPYNTERFPIDLTAEQRK